MGGNQHKLVRNKSGGANTGSNMRDAVDLESAATAMNRINSRTKRDKYEERQAKKAAEAKAKITLPTMALLKQALKRI